MEEINLSDFLERTSSDSDDDCGIVFDDVASKTEHTKNRFVDRSTGVLRMQIKNNLSNKARKDVIKLMNSHPEAAVQLPESEDTIEKLLVNDLNYTVYLHCDKCDEFVEDKKKCKCGTRYNKCSKKNNFFVHFALREQILAILKRHFDFIISYLDRKHNNGYISDVDDGNLLKKIILKNSHARVLSLTLNTDGGRMFNSSKSSLWPVQLYLNFLPPNIRFKSENIVISTLFYGKTKRNMKDLLYFLAVELDKFSDDVITVYKMNTFWNFIPILSLAVFDLQARKDIQAMREIWLPSVLPSRNSSEKFVKQNNDSIFKIKF